MFQEQSAVETGDGGGVENDANGIDEAFDPAVQALDWVGRVQLGQVLLGQAMKVGTSAPASSRIVASFGTLVLIFSATARHCGC